MNKKLSIALGLVSSVALASGFFGGGGGSGWGLSGNTGTTAGTNYIGTQDAKDFVFKTNNTERFRILSTGELQTQLTASRALTTDASKNIVASSVTSTELGYSSGVTSAIQTQLNGKEPTQTKGSISTTTTGVTIGSGSNSTVGPNVTVNIQTASGSQPGLISAADWTTFNGKQNSLGYTPVNKAGDTMSGNLAFSGTTKPTLNSNETASSAVVTDASNNLVTLPLVSATEIGYLDGVTQAIQTQFTNATNSINAALAGKVAKSGDTMTGVLQLTNGVVGTPALNFGDTASGLYRSNTNEVAISANGTQVVKFAGGGATFNTALFATGQYKGNTGGTVTAPVFVPHNSATNSGIYAPNSGDVAVTTAGSERIRFTSTGNILVGTTTNSTGLLQVAGSLSLNGVTSGQVTYTAPATAGTQSYTLPTGQPASDGQFLTSTSAGVQSWSSALPAGTTGPFVLKAGDTMTGALALPSGGLSTPSINFNGDSTLGFYYSTGAGGIGVVQGGVTRVLLTATGRGAFTSNGSLSFPTVAIGTGWASSGAPGLTTTGSDLLLATGAASRVRITSAGNVLVGTTADSATGTLQVSGGVSLNGSSSGTVAIAAPATAGTQAYTLPTSLPSANGQTMTATTGGVMSWSSASSTDSSLDIRNLGVTASVSASAMTINLTNKAGATPSGGSPVLIGFRNATATVGQYDQISVSGALSITISSGATLGHSSGVDEPIYLYAINNAGTAELAVSANGQFDEGSTQNTTAMSSSATSQGLLYSTSARTGVAIRRIGRLISNQTTAGTYAATPTEVSLAPFAQNVVYSVRVKPNNPTATCTISDQSGGKNGAWIASAASTGGADGLCNLTVATGIFKRRPKCTCMPTAGGGTIFCNQDTTTGTPTATFLGFRNFISTTGVGSTGSNTMDIFCQESF